MSPRANILVVCEGNICRSPLAEAILAERLPDADLHSAGLRAVVGAGMDSQSARQAERLGIGQAEHVARWLTEQHVMSADVILTMTVEQRTRVVQLSPVAMRRVFTLREFALVTEAMSSVDGAGRDRLRAAAAWGDQTRAARQGQVLDIDDPYRRDDPVHARVADEIFAACESMARQLGR